MSSHERRTPQRRGIYVDITGKLIGAIEADPGKPSLPFAARDPLQPKLLS